jgi:hypothetical protein
LNLKYVAYIHFINGKKEGKEVPVVRLPKPQQYQGHAQAKTNWRLVLVHPESLKPYRATGAKG